MIVTPTWWRKKNKNKNHTWSCRVIFFCIRKKSSKHCFSPFFRMHCAFKSSSAPENRFFSLFIQQETPPHPSHPPVSKHHEVTRSKYKDLQKSFLLFFRSVGFDFRLFFFFFFAFSRCADFFQTSVWVSEWVSGVSHMHSLCMECNAMQSCNLQY